MKSLKIIAAVLLLASVTGCTKPGQTTAIGSATGGVLGAGLGAIVGNQTGSAGGGLVIGAVAGAAAGGAVGNALEAQQEAIKTQDEAIERQERVIETQKHEIASLRQLQNDSPGGDVSRRRVASGATASGERYAASDRYLGNGRLSAERSRKTAATLHGKSAHDRLAKSDNRSKSYANLPAGGRESMRGSYRYQTTTKTKNLAHPQQSRAETHLVAHPESVAAVAKALNEPRTSAAREIVEPSRKVRIQERDLTESGSAETLGSATPNREGGAGEDLSSNDPSRINSAESASDSSADCKLAKDEFSKSERAFDTSQKLFHIRRALTLCPNDAEYHNGIGELYLKLSRSEDAKFEFQEALRVEPGFAPAKDNLRMLNGKKQ